VKVYAFEEIGPALELLPLCARRALDVSGLKLSLAAWQKLPLSTRQALCELGSERHVDTAAVALAAAAAAPAPEPIPRLAEDPATADPSIASGLGRAIAPSTWAALAALDRYALTKLATRGRQERLVAAHAEIVGESENSPHLGPRGGVRMIDVAEKQPTLRSAVAETRVTMTADALGRLASAPKGDVLGTARLAAIMAAKRTADLIPLCHPLRLTRIDVDARICDDHPAVEFSVTVEALDRTGVEMEALTAASVAALTVYDMLKAFDRTMQIGPTRLVAKSGGRSGDYRR
jgi:cyclic pyranopterin phosphate synthase